MSIAVEEMFKKETEARAKKAYGEGRMEGREEGERNAIQWLIDKGLVNPVQLQTELKKTGKTVKGLKPPTPNM